jgi:phosphoglycolate phosphatase
MDCPIDSMRRRSIQAPRLVLFDVDGTLMKSHGGVLRAMTRAARGVFGPTFDLEAVDRNGRLDPEIIGMALELNGVQATPEELGRFRTAYLEEMRTELTSIRLLPGALELLERLRAAENVILGLVTGNYLEAARMKLEAARIDPSWFVVGGFGGQAPTRSRLVRLAIDSAESLVGQPIPTRRVIVIGDTPRDVQCAKANGCACVAVATGNYAGEVLQAAGADAVLPNLTDPAPLWAMLDEGSECPD